jgi:hypothetical protein
MCLNKSGFYLELFAQSICFQNINFQDRGIFMKRTIIACWIIMLIASQPLNARPNGASHFGDTRSLKALVAKGSKPFDPQKLIGVGIDTARIFFAMIGRTTEEKQGGEIHLHALSDDSLSHGERPSEADAIIGKNGSRLVTLSYYKLTPDQLKKFTDHDFAGGKLLSFSGELEFPNMFGHVEMNAKSGTFIMTCRAK